MTLVLKDSVKQTSTSGHSGASDGYVMDASGTFTGFLTFQNLVSAGDLSNGDTTFYCATLASNFEVGIGTWNNSASRLDRTTILASTNSNNAVNWASGAKTVFITYPAGQSATIGDAVSMAVALG